MGTKIIGKQRRRGEVVESKVKEVRDVMVSRVNLAGLQSPDIQSNTNLGVAVMCI